MGLEWHVWGEKRMRTKFWYGKEKARDNLEDLYRRRITYTGSQRARVTLRKRFHDGRTVLDQLKEQKSRKTVCSSINMLYGQC
jgi:hypothetical protein